MNQAHDIPDQSRHILSVAQGIIGAKGYAAVGLTEILSAANVPKGSFYHYFKSKDAFGEALLQQYFHDYLAELDDILATPGNTAAQRLMAYWQHWQTTQETGDCQGKCLAVKLGAEVADLSEAMRLALQAGTVAIIGRLQHAIQAGLDDGSLQLQDDAAELAQTLYQLWLGASLITKINRDKAPLAHAMRTTRKLLQLD